MYVRAFVRAMEMSHIFGNERKRTRVLRLTKVYRTQQSTLKVENDLFGTAIHSQVSIFLLLGEYFAASTRGICSLKNFFHPYQCRQDDAFAYVVIFAVMSQSYNFFFLENNFKTTIVKKFSISSLRTMFV